MKRFVIVNIDAKSIELDETYLAGAEIKVDRLDNKIKFTWPNKDTLHPCPIYRIADYLDEILEEWNEHTVDKVWYKIVEESKKDNCLIKFDNKTGNFID